MELGITNFKSSKSQSIPNFWNWKPTLLTLELNRPILELTSEQIEFFFFGPRIGLVGFTLELVLEVSGSRLSSRTFRFRV